MNKTILSVLISLMLFTSCSKNLKQGSVDYNLEYRLPDSLKKYLDYLPKTAKVYFKGDSAISIQDQQGESTTVITYKPTNFMRVLLKSATRQYLIDYTKKDQADELALMPSFTYKATGLTRTIAGYKASKYLLTDKATGDTTAGWFTKDIAMPRNSLIANLDTTYGVPLVFTINQNGMTIKTTVKQIKFEPVDYGKFGTPAGYQPITPKQLREMPVEN